MLKKTIEFLNWRKTKLAVYQDRLRTNKTPTELRFYGFARYLAATFKTGLNFQHVIYVSVKRSYIIDFYFPAVKIAIELDGDTHNAFYDSLRDQRLKKLGIKTIRFRNEEIIGTFDSIRKSLIETFAHSTARPKVPE